MDGSVVEWVRPDVSLNASVLPHYTPHSALVHLLLFVIILMGHF